MAELPPGFVPQGAPAARGNLPPGFVIQGEQQRRENFFQRVNRDLDSRAEMFREIQQARKDGQQGWAISALQIAGKVGYGTAFDVLGEGVTSLSRSTNMVLSAITPDVIENPIKDGASYAAHMFMDSPAGRKGMSALGAGVQAWDNFKREDPRTARSIEAVVNIALVHAPVKRITGGSRPRATGPRAAAPASTPAAPPSAVGRAAASIETRAANQVTGNTQQFSEKLVRPIQSIRALEREVPRTAEIGRGLMRRNVVVPTTAERESARAVAAVPGMAQSTRTMQGSYDLIASDVNRQARSLTQSLTRQNIPVTQAEVKGVLDGISSRLSTQTLLVGDAERTAVRIIGQANRIFASEPKTAAGLLRARQRLDQWVRTQRGTGVFSPDKETAISTALREVRQGMNRLVEAKAPGSSASLGNQSALLRAMDAVAPKAAREGNNTIVRAWRNLLGFLPFRGEFNQSMAAIWGVGGLGASALFAPFFTAGIGISGVSYVAGGLVLSPTAKRGLAMMLRQIDDVIATGTANAGVVQQLRLDRAALVEMMRKAEVTDESPTEQTPSEVPQ